MDRDKSNKLDRSGDWLLRKIISQCDTGEVKIADKNGEDVRIIDLTKFSYHFVKPPGNEGPASSVKTGRSVKDYRGYVKESFEEAFSPDPMVTIPEDGSDSNDQ